MKTRTKLIWVAALYLAQGLPFGLFQECIPIYLRVHGVSLREIGLFSLLGLPWSVKVLWAPFVDRYGAFRGWISGALAGMGALLIALPAIDPSAPGPLLWMALLAFTCASSTQDVAIDGATITLLDRHEIGTANGVRVAAYRIAMILGGGGLVAIAGLVRWDTLFRGSGIAFFVLALVALRLPQTARDPEARRRPVRGLLPWLRRPYAGVVLLFVLLYKLGDAAMAPMARPFWVDRGLTLIQIGMITTTLGIAASILGALIGGWFTSRIGLLGGLWILGLFQAGSNLLYAGVAAWEGGRAAIYGAAIFESFSGGLGTAAFLAFLMSICRKEHAATQYALLSALFGLGRSVAGALSGWGSEAFGYAAYFGLTFFLALPAYALLPWVSRYLRRAESQG